MHTNSVCDVCIFPNMFPITAARAAIQRMKAVSADNFTLNTEAAG